jgi:hypothetical protein
MKKTILFLFLASSSFLSLGQGSAEYGPGLKIDLNPEKTKYVRFIIWNQIWARQISQNPGTAINGNAADKSFDIGARRLRMLAYAQISPRFLVLTHFGINNQTFLNGGATGTSGTGGYGAGKKPQLFFHDVWSEYAIALPKKDKKASLSIGAGLHYWWGISRMTSASTLNFLAIDAPVFNWPLIENSDQFARLFGIYAKGKIGKLEYRVNVNKPYATNLVPVNATSEAARVAVDNNGVSKLSTGGYFEYQFFDQEANTLPFKVGTYLGTKKVFNIGAGYYNQPEGTQSSVNGVISKHPIRLLSVDAFADIPVGDKKKNAAITAYSVFYNYDFGPNYIRNIGIMNVGTADAKFTGEKALAGAGNSRPMIGTGNIWYTQAGILLPKQKEKPAVRVQPFGAYTRKDFQALAKGGNYFDLGSNFLIEGHHAKITAQYSTRPIYTAKDKISGNKGEFLVQFQTYL